MCPENKRSTGHSSGSPLALAAGETSQREEIALENPATRTIEQNDIFVECSRGRDGLLGWQPDRKRQKEAPHRNGAGHSYCVSSDG